MRKNYLFGTSLPLRLRSLVGISFLLTTVACGACKNDNKDDKDKNKKDEKTPLKFTLTAPDVERSMGLYGAAVGDLFNTPLIKMKVTDGKDDAANYKIKVEEDKASKLVTWDYSPPNIDNGAERAKLFFPIDRADLKTILSTEELKKDDVKDIMPLFTPNGAGCTSKSGSVKISIVDKDGKVVGGPVEVKWTDGA